jgi:hypothetical protein
MSNKKLTAKQNALLHLQEERKKLIEPFLKNDELTEGSYVEVLQKCGRPGCHCEKRPTHLVSRVSKWIDGKLKHKVVRIEDRDQVRKLVETYKKHKAATTKLAKGAQKEKEIMTAIIKLKNRPYE